MSNYKLTRDEYAGSQVTETAITRVGGATDGTQAQSTKIVTNAQATFLTPYRELPMAIWNDVTGTDVTVTVYGTVNAGALPLNDEIWLECQYLGNSGSPLASFKSSSKSHPLATGAAVASDGSTWNGGGSGAGWSPFKLVATLTSPQPQQRGYIYARVMAGKPSTIFYIDPKVDVASTGGVTTGPCPVKATRDEYSGSQITETAITRVGGASVGGVAVSAKLATNAQATFLTPYRALPLAIWNDVTGADVTVTVCGTVSAASLPNNDEIWMEVQYLGDASYPLAKFKFTSKSHPLAAPAAVASDGSTWNNVAAGGDPYFNNVKLLLGFNGVNGAVSGAGMTDESSALRGAATVNGAAQISTAQSVFGGSSLALNGTNANLTYPDHSDWTLSNQPFTLECRIYPATLSGGVHMIVSQWFSATVLGWVLWHDNNLLQFVLSDDGTTNRIVASATLPAVNTWYAVAVDFDGAKYRLYINGVMVNSSTTVYTVFDSSVVLCIGANTNGPSTLFNGNIDEIRYTKGIARYANDSGYTVATAAFPRNGTWLPFKLTATLTSPQPQQKGYITARVMAGKPSATYYLDPKIALS